METTVYLIRHGEVEYKYDASGRRLIYAHNTHLSAKGETQIWCLSEKLKNKLVRIDRIYTSPYTRAAESARIIWEKYDCWPKVKCRDGLKDIWAQGWIGIPIDDLRAIGGDIYSQFPKSSDQETVTQLESRIVTTFNQILKESHGKIVVVVGHGDPIRLLIYRLQQPEGALPKMNELVKFDYINKGQAWRLVFDEKSHLVEKELITPDERTVKGERTF